MNILTQEQKDEVHALYKRKFIVVILMAMSFVGMIFLIAVIPVYFQIAGQTSVLEKEIANIQSSELAVIQQQRNKDVQEANTLLNLFGDSSESLRQYIDYIVNEFDGVVVNEVNVDYQDGKIEFGGNAATRKDFVEMTNKLQTIDWAEGVVVPVSQFTKSEDIPFRFTIQLNENAYGE